ncbi:autotransporter-associated beta strand repeat-containing protein, partial [Rhizobiaceae sp. 2RAB30]
GLTFDGGALSIGASFATARDSVVNTGGGTLELNGYTFTTSGTITGSGRLTLQGSGTLLLAGAASHTGGTTISGGTLEIGNGGSLSGAIVNDGSL